MTGFNSPIAPLIAKHEDADQIKHEQK
jgi:hypothetical protein